MKTKTFIFAILTVLVLVACTSQASAPTGIDQITVQLKWVHTSQFAGYYVAEQQGYYADEGLGITFLPGGANIDVLSPVVNGTAQFGIAGATQLISMRDEGKPVRAIATIFRRDPTVFFALASSGINSPQDFEGKTIRAVSDQSLLLHTMLNKFEIFPDQYTEVNLPSDIDLVVSGDAQIWGGYLTALALRVQRAGYEINVIYPGDYGAHFYGDTLYSTDDYIANNPDIVLRFLRATLKGWAYALENQTEVGALVAQYNPDVDVELENAMMNASFPLIFTGDNEIGWMKPEIWNSMENTMREQGLLAQPLDASQLYTLKFLEEIYK